MTTRHEGLEGRVVFLGDSISEYGDWEAWFPDVPVLNRGVSGETVAEVHARLDDALHAPRLVSVLAGTNDLSIRGPDADVEPIARDIAALVEDIRHRAPEATVLVNGVLPRSAEFVEAVETLNSRCRTIAESASAEFFDATDALADGNGVLRREFTDDSVHLTPAGYDAWVGVLRPRIESILAGR